MLNSNAFPTIAGMLRIKKLEPDVMWADWTMITPASKYVDIECAMNTSWSFWISDTKKIECRNDSVTLTKPKWNISFKILKTKNVDLLWLLLGLTVENTQAQLKSINITVALSSEDNAEILERSSDFNWIQNIVVKSEDLSTTYVDWTDYTSSLTWTWTTLITRIASGSIPAGAILNVVWEININSWKLIELEMIQRVESQFAVELVWLVDWKQTSLRWDRMTLSWDYLLEMYDVFLDWDIKWAELSFESVSGSKLWLLDENI